MNDPYKRITVTMKQDQYNRIVTMAKKLGLPMSKTLMLAFGEYEAMKKFQDDPQKIRDIMIDLQKHLDTMK